MVQSCQVMQLVRMHQMVAADWQHRHRGLVHGYVAGLVLCLSPSDGRLLGHDLLALVGEYALFAHARTEATVPLVTLQCNLEAVIATACAIGRCAGCHRRRRGRGAATEVRFRIVDVGIGHVVTPVRFGNHMRGLPGQVAAQGRGGGGGASRGTQKLDRPRSLVAPSASSTQMTKRRVAWPLIRLYHS